MKLLIAMLAVGLLGACPLLAQEAKVRVVEIKPEKVVVIEDGECEECEELDKAIEDALKNEDLTREIREALEKFRKELKKGLEKPAESKGGENDVDETTEEILPDGTKIVRRIVRKTSKSESKSEKSDGKDVESELDDELKKLSEEMEKLQKEIDEKIRKIMEEQGEEGDAEEIIEKDLPGGGKIKIVKRVSRSGSTPKQPEAPRKSDESKQ